jgi:hypothetical protein
MVTVNEDRAQFRQDTQQEQEWLRQLNLIYSGLIGIGVVMIQPFLTAASLDLTAKICVVAFSVAIPLLAALVVVNRQEVSVVARPRPSLPALRGWSRRRPPSLVWSPASGTFCGSPGWGCWPSGW